MYWLMKSEPEDYSIQQFKKDKSTLWSGVRNYQARNFMIKEMKKGDWVLFYHSNATPPGVAGLAKVSSKEAVPDPTQFDKRSKYYEERASKDNPVWKCVELSFVEELPEFVSLETIKSTPALKEMAVLKKGNRLSILPVNEKDFATLTKMAKSKKFK